MPWLPLRINSGGSTGISTIPCPAGSNMGTAAMGTGFSNAPSCGDDCLRVGNLGGASCGGIESVPLDNSRLESSYPVLMSAGSPIVSGTGDCDPGVSDCLRLLLLRLRFLLLLGE